MERNLPTVLQRKPYSEADCLHNFLGAWALEALGAIGIEARLCLPTLKM
jgi:hypothetical protein